MTSDGLDGMSEQPKDIYGLESSGATPPPAPPESPDPAPASGAPRAGKPIDGAPIVIPSSKSEPLPLEDEMPLSMRPVKDLDVCPNCGAPMPNTGEVLCMRCGFDLKTMKQVKVETGVVEVPPEGSLPEEIPPDQRKPLVVPGRGGIRAPLIVAAASGVILLLAYMIGVRGVFLPNPEGDITFGMRMLGIVRLIVTTGMIAVCGLGSLWFMSFLFSMRMGDWQLAAARMLGIAAAIQLVTLVNFSGNGVEWTVEAILQAALFAALAFAFFGIKPKDAPTLLGGTVILYVLLQMAAWLVTSVAR